MKMTITDFLSDKSLNRRVLQRNITASLNGDKAAKKRLLDKYGITSVQVIGRAYLLNVDNNKRLTK